MPIQRLIVPLVGIGCIMTTAIARCYRQRFMVRQGVGLSPRRLVASYGYCVVFRCGPGFIRGLARKRSISSAVKSQVPPIC